MLFHYKVRPNRKRPFSGHLAISLIVSIVFLSESVLAKKVGGIKKITPVKTVVLTQEDQDALYKYSFSSPFRYHYSPWVTRKLLLTLNATSTNTHYSHISLEAMKSLKSDHLEDDYECNDPSVVRNKLLNISTVSIKIDEFKNSKDLNCNERVYLQSVANDKNIWPKCEELNANTVDSLCAKAGDTAERFTKNNDIDEKTAHNELKDILNNYSLKYCSKFALKDVLSSVNRKRILGQIKYSGTCGDVFLELVKLDALVNFFSCEFDQILSRIYCQGYSVKETCDECSSAYKQWLCSQILPYHIEDLLIKPCLSICQRVERTCPYLHPEMKDQYGGEPIFICNDPDIPIAKNSTDEPYGKDRGCYQKCHLEANYTLTMKSLQMKNITINTKEEVSFIASEEALQENPELEICIPRETIIKKLNVSTGTKYEDNEAIEARLMKLNKTEEEKSKRDLDSKWPSEGYNSARMVDQIELEEEEIVEEINKETILEENRHQLDDIYYLDSNNSQLNEECNQTNSSVEQFKYKNLKQEQLKQLKDQKPVNLEQHAHQSQVSFHHFSEDDENDNEDGLDDDLADQVISTTTITSFVVSKQTNHQNERKQ